MKKEEKKEIRNSMEEMRGKVRKGDGKAMESWPIEIITNKIIKGIKKFEHKKEIEIFLEKELFVITAIFTFDVFVGGAVWCCNIITTDICLFSSIHDLGGIFLIVNLNEYICEQSI